MIAWNSSVHSSTLHIFNVERYVGWGCILNCFMLSPYLLSMLFADLLSLHLVTFLMFFFILVHVTFFSSRCMIELKFAIYHRAASLSSQASSVDEVLVMQYWPKNIWPDQALFKHSPHTNCNSNSANLCNNYTFWLSDLCTCVHMKKKWRHKGSHSSSVSGSNHLMRLQTWKKAMGWCTAQWKMLLFCAKTIVKESCKFELVCLKKKKKKKEKHCGRLTTFWFSTFG